MTLHCSHVQDYYWRKSREALREKDYAAISFYLIKSELYRKTCEAKAPQPARRREYVWHAKDLNDRIVKPQTRRRKFKKAA